MRGRQQSNNYFRALIPRAFQMTCTQVLLLLNWPFSVFRVSTPPPPLAPDGGGGVGGVMVLPYMTYILKAQNYISDSSRQKYANKEIKKDYRLEEYLKDS